MASLLSSSSSILFSHTTTTTTTTQLTTTCSPNLLTAGKARETRRPWIKAVSSAEPEKEKKIVQTSSSPEAKPATTTPLRPKKPEYSMKKGQIVRVDKEKYLNSINYLSVGHPPYYKGLDYIYEDRGEVLDIRIFETGEYALIWVLK